MKSCVESPPVDSVERIKSRRVDLALENPSVFELNIHRPES